MSHIHSKTSTFHLHLKIYCIKRQIQNSSGLGQSSQWRAEEMLLSMKF